MAENLEAAGAARTDRRATEARIRELRAAQNHYRAAADESERELQRLAESEARTLESYPKGVPGSRYND